MSVFPEYFCCCTFTKKKCDTKQTIFCRIGLFVGDIVKRARRKAEVLRPRGIRLCGQERPNSCYRGHLLGEDLHQRYGSLALNLEQKYKLIVQVLKFTYFDENFLRMHESEFPS